MSIPLWSGVDNLRPCWRHVCKHSGVMQQDMLMSWREAPLFQGFGGAKTKMADECLLRIQHVVVKVLET